MAATALASQSEDEGVSESVSVTEAQAASDPCIGRTVSGADAWAASRAASRAVGLRVGGGQAEGGGGADVRRAGGGLDAELQGGERETAASGSNLNGSGGGGRVGGRGDGSVAVGASDLLSLLKELRQLGWQAPSHSAAMAVARRGAGGMGREVMAAPGSSLTRGGRGGGQGGVKAAAAGGGGGAHMGGTPQQSGAVVRVSEGVRGRRAGQRRGRVSPAGLLPGVAEGSDGSASNRGSGLQAVRERLTDHQAFLKAHGSRQAAASVTAGDADSWSGSVSSGREGIRMSFRSRQTFDCEERTDATCPEFLGFCLMRECRRTGDVRGVVRVYEDMVQAGRAAAGRVSVRAPAVSLAIEAYGSLGDVQRAEGALEDALQRGPTAVDRVSGCESIKDGSAGARRTLWL